jgi:hypothetical protein
VRSVPARLLTVSWSVPPGIDVDASRSFTSMTILPRSRVTARVRRWRRRRTFTLPRPSR